MRAIVGFYYQRLLDNGKPKMLALVAVMKKLLLMIQAILKRKKMFDPGIFTLDLKDGIYRLCKRKM